jgi:hypothetical protein
MSPNETSGGPVNRDSAWINREYGGDKWPAISRNIEEACSQGERSLGRLVASLARWEWEFPKLDPIASVMQGSQVSLPGAVAWYGTYALISEAIISCCRNDTAAVLDLGSGWGRSLFDVWLRGGPRDATYYAMEFTKAGLDCVSALASLEPSMAVRAIQFDFHKPDFSAVTRPLRHAVVFTVSSLHQVPVVDRKLFREIAEIADIVDGLHFEQIGWQINPSQSSDADRNYARQHDYNSNLWPVLQHLKETGTIDLIDVRADLIGTQDRYPLSLVHWRSVTR